MKGGEQLRVSIQLRDINGYVVANGTLDSPYKPSPGVSLSIPLRATDERFAPEPSLLPMYRVEVQYGVSGEGGD